MNAPADPDDRQDFHNASVDEDVAEAGDCGQNTWRLGARAPSSGAMTARAASSRLTRCRSLSAISRLTTNEPRPHLMPNSTTPTL